MSSNRVGQSILLAAAAALLFFLNSIALGQSAPDAAEATSALPSDWRDIKEGVDGYPAGPMLEIALRRTHGDKLEMFKWRSEFISMLSAQPGPLVEREWHSISGIPANTGAGTWTGMTLWENQQRWQDMANMLFPSPVTSNWLQTIYMTLIFVKSMDENFDLRTLAQSGEEVLEMGLLVFPVDDSNDSEDRQSAAIDYLDEIGARGAEVYRFDIYPNPSGFNGPYTAAYNQNGPPGTEGEVWFVYMATYQSLDTRDEIHDQRRVRRSLDALLDAVYSERSDIQIMTRTTSKVCCTASNMCVLDPEDCSVGMLGSGDTWAGNCSECPRPCETGYGVCSMLSSKTCSDVGGTQVDSCPVLSESP